MKYVVVIGDGMADYPLEELNNKTVLQASVIPNMDFIASNGTNGLLKTVPEGMQPGSDVANLSIMGYDPKKYYTGRGPLEAASIGADLQNGEVAFRCNFITAKDGKLADFNANHISTGEAKELIDTLNQEFAEIGKFYLGVSYRHLFVMDNTESASLKSTPPHDVVGEGIEENLLKPYDDKNAELLNKIMRDSVEILEDHPVNKKRVADGKYPANMIWLWGQGTRPNMDPFIEKYGLKGATITGVDLIKGLGSYLGLTNINVPGATGYFDTDYSQKANYAVDTLNDHDLVFVHVEAPDEAGHAGDITEKIKAIESIDEKIIGKLLDELPKFDDYAISILPDHATPISVKTHTTDAIPYAMCSTNGVKDNVNQYNEFSAKMGSLGTIEGHKFMKSFLDI
ncbi:MULTISPECIES: cofactor-independent phosphoglycerate mutase [Methanobacterium]|jgi:2,3-bisphosphoglycerate-independent phosphoglycerate mutase|uniref:2,3-bisphosphoglycerate-independent phosphoglycerate mutase n=1 Tax=Methanobacterium veterum TaxID=408577 RepID=A0A9E5A4Y0_9EURY|nr:MULTISPECIES: cofactor-independent phosphoglycerate mutase [Methanobacterium]MCZ3367287.1 cofactor-independent phosphoglycerate mutase [Methanobacterium veterum]MCZ3373565.1 cofactor-independent phosphoglycerate mutase [Methanobacterium veterum]